MVSIALPKSKQLSKKQYAEMHSKIKHKLYREAFEEKYSCHFCGEKNNLHIHYLVYDPAQWDNPDFYQVVCGDCHRLQHPRHRLHSVVLKPNPQTGG